VGRVAESPAHPAVAAALVPAPPGAEALDSDRVVSVADRLPPYPARASTVSARTVASSRKVDASRTEAACRKPSACRTPVAWRKRVACRKRVAWRKLVAWRTPVAWRNRIPEAGAFRRRHFFVASAPDAARHCAASWRR